MALPRYHTCASLPTCRIYVHPFRNSFGLIELCRLSQDTRLTSDSCSSGWSFVIGFLHQGRCLPRLARLTRPSPVRADSGLSPHRHTCAAGRTNKNPGLFRNRGSWNGEPDDVLLSLEIQPTIIGDKVFTVLFGMGRSGTTSLWSSGKGFAARAANSSLGQKQS